MERNDPCWCGSGKKYKKMPYADRRKNKTAQRQRGNCTFQKAFEDSGAD